MPSTYPLPFARTWWISPGRVLGGPFPGDRHGAITSKRLTALLNACVRRIVCLQEEDERGRDGKPFTSYLQKLRHIGSFHGTPVVWSRHPIPEQSAPTTDQVCEILTALAAAEGIVYVHCWGGHGRTGTVAGCLLREQGMTATEALAAITAARAHDRYLAGQPCPQTAAQVEMVRSWQPRGRR